MKINNSRSFRANMDAGATREELMIYYALTPGQFEKVMTSLQEIRSRKTAKQ